MCQFSRGRWFVPPLIVPLFLLLLILAVVVCMDRTAQLRYLVSGNNQFDRVNLGRATAAGALKKAKELWKKGIWT